jgi:hypothetical protein
MKPEINVTTGPVAFLIEKEAVAMQSNLSYCSAHAPSVNLPIHCKQMALQEPYHTCPTTTEHLHAYTQSFTTLLPPTSSSATTTKAACTLHFTLRSSHRTAAVVANHTRTPASIPSRLKTVTRCLCQTTLNALPPGTQQHMQLHHATLSAACRCCCTSPSQQHLHQPKPTPSAYTQSPSAA